MNQCPGFEKVGSERKNRKKAQRIRLLVPGKVGSERKNCEKAQRIRALRPGKVGSERKNCKKAQHLRFAMENRGNKEIIKRYSRDNKEKITREEIVSTNPSRSE